MGVIFEHFNFVVVIVLMMTGLYVVFASNNMIKKLVGLSVFQTSVFLLYISMGKVTNGQPPIIPEEDLHAAPDPAAIADTSHAPASSMAESGHPVSDIIYSNPLPHVLILTAIVVGVATLAIGLALVVRTREVYNTIEIDEIDAITYQKTLEKAAR